MRPITLWYAVTEKDKERNKAFNHIEDGHSDKDCPHANTEIQKKSWQGQTWEKEHKHIDDEHKIVD